MAREPTADENSGAIRDAAPPASAAEADGFPTLFLDYNIGRHKVADALRAVGAHCELHSDHFRQDEIDEVWLTEVGSRGWFVLTKDQRIGSRANEIEALQSAGVGAFVFASAGLTGTEMAIILAKAWPKMMAFARENRRPFIAKIYKDCRVMPWK